MRSLLAVIVFGACARTVPATPPRNVAYPAITDEPDVDEVVIDPDSKELQAKRSYWRRSSRAYMSQIPGAVTVCTFQPTLVMETPRGPQTYYVTICSDYR